MKKIFTLVLLGLFLTGNAQTTLEKTYYFKAPVVRQMATEQAIEFESTTQQGIAGEPLLPYHAINLLLPPGQEAISVSIQGFDETEMPGFYKLQPAQYSRPLSASPSPVRTWNKEVYQLNEVYPATPAGHLSTRYMNGHAMAQTVFTPVKYIPASGTVSYYGKVKITIQTQPSAKAEAALHNLRTSEKIQQSIIQSVQNPEALADYTSNSRNRSNEYQILIITRESFVQPLEVLRQVYLPRGLKSQFATIESIGSMTGQDLPEKIRNYIVQEYQQHGIEHVVLAGDVEHVPYRGFYCTVQSSTTYEDYDIPADLYYAALDGNWNTNGNSRWGEIGEDDLLPEISVGRMPFSSAYELAAMLNKTTLYQNQPVTGELRNPLLAGEHLYSGPDTWGSDYLELLIGTHNDNGYTTTGIPEDHNFTRLYDENGVWGKIDLINTINAGRNFIHHVGHANSDYVMKLNNGDITNLNFFGVDGVAHNFPVVYTHGCICGAFDVNDCIGEKMVTIDNFASAFVGNSRYGWFNEGQTEGPSQHLHREFMHALFTDSLSRIGRTHTQSKIATAPWVNAPGQWEEGALRWCFYDCNVLGDPMMAVWTDEPITISVDYPETLTTGTSQFNVTVTSGGQAASGLTVALLMNGELYGTGMVANNGEAIVILDPVITEPGDAQLVVSGYNCLPHYFPVSFVSGNSAYVVYNAHQIDDTQGNGNGQPDNGETLSLTITLENIGLADASDVLATLTTTNPNVTILDATAPYGNISAGQQVTVDQGFTIELSAEVPDQEMIEFTLSAVAGDTWLSAFQLTANAPVLQAGEAVLTDNDNNIPDPGEEFDISIPLYNTGHAISRAVEATLNCSSTWISPAALTINLDALDAGESIPMIFSSFVADEQAPMGTVIDFTLSLYPQNSTQLLLQKAFSYTLGQIIEDFESGDFTQMPWNHSLTPWTVSGQQVQQGMFAAQSGAISHNQRSDLSINVSVVRNDSLSFYLKTSSEKDYDKLIFFIDDVRAGEWSGDTDWKRVSYLLSPGDHQLKWSYVKDVYSTAGSDAAWIDYIVFPALDLSVGVEKPLATGRGMQLLPNPAQDKVEISMGNRFSDPAELLLTDLSGRILMHETGLYPNTRINFGLEALSSGLYLCILRSAQHTETQKLIVR
jgi:hypothetical protein